MSAHLIDIGTVLVAVEGFQLVLLVNLVLRTYGIAYLVKGEMVVELVVYLDFDKGLERALLDVVAYRET